MSAERRFSQQNAARASNVSFDGQHRSNGNVWSMAAMGRERPEIGSGFGLLLAFDRLVDRARNRNKAFVKMLDGQSNYDRTPKSALSAVE